ALEERWQVPGGMAGVVGWQSDLYKFVPEGGSVWVGGISVKNSLGYFQTEGGWKRSYPVGAWFADVLSHRGKVFEVRFAEKQDDGWHRYVAFKDRAARPPGYTGLKQSCASCHDGDEKPGSGG